MAVTSLHVLNSSRLVAWERCRREFYWESVRRLSPRTDSALATGLAWHAGLAALYRGAIHVREAVADMAAALAKYRPKEVWDVEFDGTREYLSKALEEYVEEWMSRDGGILPSGETAKHIEEPIVREVASGFKFAGVLDLITHNEESGRWTVWDHKTTKSSVSEGYLETFKHSPQMLGYAWAASQLVGELVLDVKINVFAKLRHLRERGQPFHRYDIHFSAGDLERWRETRVAQMKGVVMALPYARDLQPDGASLMFPQSTTACTRFFRPCPFMDLCWPAPQGDWRSLSDWQREKFEECVDYVDEANMVQEETRW